MALNIQTFKTRALTALIFVAVMLVGLLWNFWSFVLLFTIIHWGCWIEYLGLVEKINNTVIDKFIKQYFAFCGITLMWILGQHRFGSDVGFNFFGNPVSLKYFLWIILFVGLLAFTFQNKQINNKVKWMSFIGFVYITMPIIMLVHLSLHFNLLDVPINISGKPHFALPAWINLSDTTLYMVFPCLIIASIWINDTMAYLVGSFIGKTPFSKISPKKTWEGTIGGAVLCVVLMFYIGMILNAGGWIHQSKFVYIAIIAALCAIFGTLGDLFESKLKRMANVKDSGSFMPGHGGFLDRFDSLLFAVPAVWVFVKLFI